MALRGHELQEPAGRFQPIHVGHLDIHEDQIVGADRNPLQNFLTILSKLEPIAEDFEHGASHLPIHRIVLGNQDRFALGGERIWHRLGPQNGGG